MRFRIPLAGLAILLCGSPVFAQYTGDVLGMHNLGPTGKSPISGPSPNACSYCHAPHSGLNTGLWNQKLTTTIYTPYSSSGTEKNPGRQPTLGYSTNHCLSCHDGTVGLIGQTVAYGTLPMSGLMNPSDVLGSNMQSSHPFSLVTPLKDSPDLAASIVANHTTTDTTGAVKLFGGNVECVSCHNPHVQAKDLLSQNFLVKDSSSGQLCLACHDPARQTSGQVNPLADWSTSVHALNTGTIAPTAQLGSYKTVAANACISCHAPHNAPGTARILRGQNEQDCLLCHQTGSNVSGMSPYSILGPEYTAPKVGHPFPTSLNPHDAAENTLLNGNRHATCVDCHSPHGSESVGAFSTAPLIRVSQKDIAGIASDGTTVLTPANNQYENCLRCHGTSTNKQILTQFGYLPAWVVSDGDPLNLIPQFATGAASSHPVMHTRSSGQLQPSLLQFMTNQDGSNSTRAVGNQILCTDCHNSDDNREFGGAGPNGPHGSKFSHILERNYQFSQAGSAGGTITNLTPFPNLSAAGPYALCAKCHNLSIVQSATSWSGHINHMNDGFSCSTCHTAHGIIPTSGAMSGLRLVNFDVKVVAPNGTLPISYDHGSNTCVLVCHNEAHNPGGGVSPANSRQRFIIRK